MLVTAISPTPPGEGKTTVSVGLTDGLNAIGDTAVACLREPSMGPVFGMKGGAAGGGYSQLIPMVDINLHFTGDLAALSAATNLLAALIDNHLHHGNDLDLDPRTVTWKRALDVNDRALRHTVVGLGGTAHGVPREDGFDITAASELMAVLCLARSLPDLRSRISAIVIGYSHAKTPVTVGDLQADAALTIILREALAPNLVQTLEGNPALVHGGPFANIAHGCSSLIALETGVTHADVVVTEAGFGADLGAEKFLDITARVGDLVPDVVVLVVTVRALKYHGGVDAAQVDAEDLAALRAGMANLDRHLHNLRSYGLPVVVAVNQFATDTVQELGALDQLLADRSVDHARITAFTDGGAGAIDLAHEVRQHLKSDRVPTLTRPYELDEPLADKIRAVAQRLYGAEDVELSAAARRRLTRLEDEGFGHLPVCIAKTQYSFATDPRLRGAPTGHTIGVREVRLSAGAGFVVAICGDLMTMPGLPARPAALQMTIADDGTIAGLS